MRVRSSTPEPRHAGAFLRSVWTRTGTKDERGEGGTGGEGQETTGGAQHVEAKPRDGWAVPCVMVTREANKRAKVLEIGVDETQNN